MTRLTFNHKLMTEQICLIKNGNGRYQEIEIVKIVKDFNNKASTYCQVTFRVM